MRLHNKQTFLTGAGDRWLERNRKDLGKWDEVTDLLSATEFKPTCVLELGCANGWRLTKLRKMYGCSTFGIEPSEAAVAEARSNQLNVYKGTADKIPFPDGFFNLVIIGYCLAFTDPEDLFSTVAETDRVLTEDGRLIIHDFIASRPFRTLYEEMFTTENDEPYGTTFLYQHDWSNLWLSHPAYKKVGETFAPKNCRTATILAKNMTNAFPYIDTREDPVPLELTP